MLLIFLLFPVPASSANASQGFPNWNPPDFVVAAAQKALSEGFHQYTRTAGHPRLVQLLAKRYSKHFGREVDPFSQVRRVSKPVVGTFVLQKEWLVGRPRVCSTHSRRF